MLSRISLAGKGNFSVPHQLMSSVIQINQHEFYFKTLQKSDFFLVIVIFCIEGAIAQTNHLWQDEDASIVYSSDRYSTPTAFRTLSLDISSMRSALSQAPMEFTEAAKSKSLVITLPFPDGSMQEVTVQETQVMSPGLAANYPQIKTYSVRGVNDKYLWGRLDVTAFGFHAMIVTPSEQMFIDPVSNESNQFYVCYLKKICLAMMILNAT
jgi:hypothetical protein